jgi:hypothetical protein
MHENTTFWDYELAYRRDQVQRAAAGQRVRPSRRSRFGRSARRNQR